MGAVTAERIQHFLLIFPVLLLSVALHEFAHCWVNDHLGDDTPRRAGRVTLNPLAHLDPVGTLMMVVSSFAGIGFGWGKASPFNPANFRHPARDRMIGAVAGPLSNILQMFAWASMGLLLGAFFQNVPVIATLCQYGMVVNAALAVFNLLPIYPLDGHHLFSYLAPPSWRPIIDNPRWGFVFLALMFIGPVRGFVLEPILYPAINGLFTAAAYLVGWPS